MPGSWKWPPHRIVQLSLRRNISSGSLMCYLCSIYFEKDNTNAFGCHKTISPAYCFQRCICVFFFQLRCEKPPSSAKLLHLVCRLRPHAGHAASDHKDKMLLLYKHVSYCTSCLKRKKVSTKQGLRTEYSSFQIHCSCVFECQKYTKDVNFCAPRAVKCNIA